MNLIKPFKAELKKMVEAKVIEKVNEPTEWVNSLVIVKKKNEGGLRVCLDPHFLNQAIQREHYYIPTFEDLCSKMAGAKVFSTLDADRAFWQIKLSEQSSSYTTFNTPFGRYEFLRMPYGICSAPEVFHRCFHEMFQDMEGVEVYIDDILIWGRNRKEHDERLQRVLAKAQQRYVKFNLKRFSIGVKEVRYMGHRFSENGIEPNDNKIKAITEMNPPKNRKELETFLGMITYLGRFIPNLSQKNAFLRNLTKKNAVWLWDSNADEVFAEIKKSLVTSPILQYFDTTKAVTLSVDPSQEGLGVVILQNNLPVEYASKSMTDTEKGYAQIEKEALAIAFACERFHHYIFGREVIVESDHKPLEATVKPPN